MSGNAGGGGMTKIECVTHRSPDKLCDLINAILVVGGWSLVTIIETVDGYAAFMKYEGDAAE